MHLNNGDEQTIQLEIVNNIDNSDYNLFIPQCMMGDINELWLVAKRIIIVTLVEILRLIINVCVSKKNPFESVLIRTMFIKYLGL